MIETQVVDAVVEVIPGASALTNMEGKRLGSEIAGFPHAGSKVLRFTVKKGLGALVSRLEYLGIRLLGSGLTKP